MSIDTGMISFSEMSTYMQCPLKHHLTYVEDLVEPPEQRRPGLALGSAFHKMLECRYLAFKAADAAQQPRDLEKAREASWRGLDELTAEGRDVITQDQRDTLAWMLDGYDETYGTDEHWEIIDVERGVETPLCTLKDGREMKLAGRIDLIVRDRNNGRVWLVDFKTMKGKNASAMAWGRERDLDWQFTLYQALIATDQTPGVERIEAAAGAIYAAIRTDQLKREMTSDERFGRHLILRSPAALERAVQNAAAVVQHIAAVQGIGDPLPVFASPDPQMCGWKCSFREIHLHADATGRDYAEVARDWGFVSRGRGPVTKASGPETEVEAEPDMNAIV